MNEDGVCQPAQVGFFTFEVEISSSNKELERKFLFCFYLVKVQSSLRWLPKIDREGHSPD